MYLYILYYTNRQIVMKKQIRSMLTYSYFKRKIMNSWLKIIIHLPNLTYISWNSRRVVAGRQIITTANTHEVRPENLSRSVVGNIFLWSRKIPGVRGEYSKINFRAVEIIFITPSWWHSGAGIPQRFVVPHSD